MWLKCDQGQVVFTLKQSYMQKRYSSLGGLEPPTFRLTAERANRLRHRDGTATCQGH